MIWKRKNRSPITLEDEEFVKSSFEWIISTFGEEILSNTILTLNDFDLNTFNLNSIFSYLCKRMKIEEESIKLLTYSERRQIELGDSLFTQYSEDTSLTTGKYKQYSDGEVEIWIEERIIENPNSLIATLAHELCHYKLLYEEKMNENDEYLTDFLTVLYGLGLFGANSSIIKMNTWSSGSGSGWQIDGAQGYLHFKVWSFSLAYHFKLLKMKEVDQAYLISSMEKDIAKNFQKSLDYLNMSL